MDEVTKELLNYSVLGALVVVLSRVVHFLYKDVKAEREAAKLEREKALDAIRGTTDAVKGNTDVLHELKRLLETTRQKR